MSWAVSGFRLSCTAGRGMAVLANSAVMIALALGLQQGVAALPPIARNSALSSWTDLSAGRPDISSATGHADLDDWQLMPRDEQIEFDDPQLHPNGLPVHDGLILPPFPEAWRRISQETWDTLFYARKGGPHLTEFKTQALGFVDRARLAWASASPVDWYYLLAVLGLLLALDVTMFQHLPETVWTNFVLLVFWLFIGFGFALEIWLRLGPTDCMLWFIGYLLELLFSVDRVFVAVLVVSTLEVPRRLLAKAMFVGLLCSWAMRVLFILGVASELSRLHIVPYIAGIWLVYCGFCQVTAHKGADFQTGVTETLAVRALRKLLGNRFGEYYDEEGERIFVAGKQGLRVTLLGAAILCLLSSDALLSLDIALLKEEKVTNVFLDFSSSMVAAFATRALFFVVKDVIDIHEFTKYSLGPILVFIGIQTLVARELHVNALLSCMAVCGMLAGAAVVSFFRTGPEPKSTQ